MNWRKLEFIGAVTSELRRCRYTIGCICESLCFENNSDEYDRIYSTFLSTEKMLHTLETVSTREMVDHYFDILTAIPSVVEVNQIEVPFNKSSI